MAYDVGEKRLVLEVVGGGAYLHEKRDEWKEPLDIVILDANVLIESRLSEQTGGFDELTNEIDERFALIASQNTLEEVDQ